MSKTKQNYDSDEDNHHHHHYHQFFFRHLAHIHIKHIKTYSKTHRTGQLNLVFT